MQLISKYYICFLLIIFSSCDFKTNTKNDFLHAIPKKIENIEVPKEELILIPEKGKWYYKDVPFNGFAIKYFENDMIAERIGYYNGEKEGKAYKYFDDGSVKKEMYYIQNRLHGKSLNYFRNGNLSAESNYKFGSRNGVQKIWYPNGQLAKQRNLKEGKEEGMQQAWLENGKIYVNYEAKNGRIFGMNRANLCYQLKKEEIKYTDEK